MIFVVYDNERPEGAGTQAVDRFYGEFSVYCGLSGLDIKLTFNCLNYCRCAAHMTGCAHTDKAVMLSHGFEPERGIECYQAVQMAHGYIEIFRNLFEYFFGEIAVGFGDVL